MRGIFNISTMFSRMSNSYALRRMVSRVRQIHKSKMAGVKRESWAGRLQMTLPGHALLLNHEKLKSVAYTFALFDVIVPTSWERCTSSLNSAILDLLLAWENILLSASELPILSLKFWCMGAGNCMSTPS